MLGGSLSSACERNAPGRGSANPAGLGMRSPFFGKDGSPDFHDVRLNGLPRHFRNHRLPGNSRAINQERPEQNHRSHGSRRSHGEANLEEAERSMLLRGFPGYPIYPGCQVVGHLDLCEFPEECLHTAYLA